MNFLFRFSNLKQVKESGDSVTKVNKEINKQKSLILSKAKKKTYSMD
jgi:hypothetical protein